MPGAALGGRPNYLVKSVIYDCRYDDQVRCTRQVCRTIPKCPTEARGIILQARKLPEAVVGTVPLAATLGGLCLACRGAAPPCLAGNRFRSANVVLHHAQMDPQPLQVGLERARNLE